MTLVCNDLVRLRQTQQALPPTVVETPSLAPCQLVKGEGNTVDLPLAAAYTMLAIGQIAGKDVFVGCAVQHAYGSSQAAAIPLSFIDDRQRLATTTCVRLSDKCSGACK